MDDKEKLEILKEQEAIHKQVLEMEARKANYLTAEDYQKALDALHDERIILDLDKTETIVEKARLEERETQITEREQGIDKYYADKLKECEEICEIMIGDTKTKCAQMVEDKKVEIQSQGEIEHENIQFAINKINIAVSSLREWGYYENADFISGRLSMFYEHAENGETYASLLNECKDMKKEICMVMEKSQTAKDASQTFELRNELGGIVNELDIVLGLDDRRNGKQNTQLIESEVVLDDVRQR